MIENSEQVVKMTPRRIAALRQVHNGEVRYVQKTAAWMIGEYPTEGWDWRTFSDLRRFELVTTVSDGKAVLTEKGRQALDTLPEPRRRTTP